MNSFVVKTETACITHVWTKKVASVIPGTYLLHACEREQVLVSHVRPCVHGEHVRAADMCVVAGTADVGI